MNRAKLTNYEAPKISAKRKILLDTLPSGAQAFLQSDTRSLLHTTNLSSHKMKVVKSGVKFRPQVPKTLPFFIYTGDEELTSLDRFKIHAFLLATMYDDRSEDPRVDNNIYLSTIIGILLSYTTRASLEALGFRKALQDCHFIPVAREWTSLKELDEQTKEIRESTAESIGIDSFDSVPQIFEIIAASCMVLIGKHLVQASKDGWFHDRWRSFLATKDETINTSSIRAPELGPSQGVYAICSALFQIRAVIFSCMRSLASISSDSNSIFFEQMIDLLQWCEMGHIPLINKHLYTLNPEVLSFPELKGQECDALAVAYNYLRQWPIEDRPFLKLMVDHSNLKALHSTYFRYAIAASRAISSIDIPSMRNMTYNHSEAMLSFTKRVITFVKTKRATEVSALNLRMRLLERSS